MRFAPLRRPSLAGLALAGLLLTPQLAVAGKGQGPGGQGKAKLERMCEQIACTDDQRDDIARVFKQMRQDIKPDREAIAQLRSELASEWKRAKPDAGKLAKLGDKIAAHERNVADRRLEAMLELHAILTPSQREQIAAHLLERRRDKPKR